MSDPLIDLHRLADAAGIDTAYRDIDGRLRVARPEALLATLRALGIDVDRPDQADQARRALLADRAALEPVLVAWNGRLPSLPPLHTGPGNLTLHAETGQEMALRWECDGRGRLHCLDPIPPGVHTLHVASPGLSAETCVISAPHRVPRTLAGPVWGAFLPLHAFGNDAASPGTYADLEEAACRLGALGAALVGTLPLLVAFLDAPFEPSPYAPLSRLFWNDLFLAPAAPVEPAAGRAPLLDYRSAALTVREQLQAAADTFFAAGGADEPGFRAYLGEQPRANDYARFRAACDRYRTGFSDWPQPARDGRLEEAELDPADVRRHLFAAWQAERHIERIARKREEGYAGLYLDLPLGVHRHGYDVWRERALFAEGVTVGAPPDPLFRGGQDWGFQPLLPGAQRANRYEYVRDVLRHHMRHASALRIDHAVSLVRLFWIPEGFAATEGVYVRNPRDELLALISLEAARTGTVIVGEDLGTVPAEVRTAMAERGLLGMFVLQFAFGGQAGWPMVPRHTVASFGTHDTATFAGWWHGHDIDDQEALALLDPRSADAARGHRARLRDRLARSAGATAEDAEHAVLCAALDRLAESDAEIVMVTLEDLWLETAPQNVPGTSHERPNWRRRARYGVRAALTRPDVVDRLAHVNQLRTEVRDARP